MHFDNMNFHVIIFNYLTDRHLKNGKFLQVQNAFSNCRYSITYINIRNNVGTNEQALHSMEENYFFGFYLSILRLYKLHLFVFLTGLLIDARI